MSRAPIFIGGMFKSGTSLLRAMLGQHSAIASGLETYWFDWNWSARESDGMKMMYGRLAHCFDMSVAEVTGMAMDSATAEKFLATLMAEVARRQGKPRWAEKTPGNIAHADRIWAAWPDAKIVHIIRDPRDVFASLVEAKKWDSPEEFADRWVSTIGRGLRLKGEINPSAKSYLAIRYEDLIAAPERTMRRVIEFIGEPWEAAVAQFSGRQEDFDKVLEATGKASTTLERLKEPLSGERVGIWPQVLTQKHLTEIKRAINARGYGDIYERVTAESPAA
ncbi:MAG TPA: sulfotransferase [Xanthobacteraceae bacterium]|nr:sulfotransferase [Xanthobacteraceae bacterium]